MAKFRHRTQEEKQRAIELYIINGFLLKQESF